MKKIPKYWLPLPHPRCWLWTLLSRDKLIVNIHSSSSLKMTPLPPLLIFYRFMSLLGYFTMALCFCLKNGFFRRLHNLTNWTHYQVCRKLQLTISRKWKCYKQLSWARGGSTSDEDFVSKIARNQNFSYYTNIFDKSLDTDSVYVRCIYTTSSY